MLFLQDVTYVHANRDVLFTGLSLAINKHDKIALVGNNGAGKSTLLKILAGDLAVSSGVVKTAVRPYYVSQLFDAYNNLTIAQALGIADKLNALKAILAGEVTGDNLALLDDDWAIEERSKEAFTQWQIADLHLDRAMNTLSGGQKTKIFLAGITIHEPEIVLLDEPSNHLDTPARALLYNYISSVNATLVVVSHDRTLLNLLPIVYELSRNNITAYGGNYDFYALQKNIESEALDQSIKNKEKALHKARETEREAAERQQKLDARGRKKQEQAGLPTISMNTLRNNAEQSTARMKAIHDEKVTGIAGELNKLRKELPDADKMKLNLDNAALHKGKILITATDVSIGYNGQRLQQRGMSFQIVSGERIAIAGANGSGKTTLVKTILGELPPLSGMLERAAFSNIVIDQDYSLINSGLTVYEQAQQFNTAALQEHEVKIRLSRFLFKGYWDKPCAALSGGEKMRLILCCLIISNHAPDMIVLDEPTNNLDLQNIAILTAAIKDYRGTVLVVSHDEYFLEEINVTRTINME